MPRIFAASRFALIAGFGAILSLGPNGARAEAQQPSFRDFPYVIYCEYSQITNAYYFSRLGADGRAIYMTPDRQVGTISLTGVAERISGEQPGSCRDKTLSDLRKEGRAFDLPR